MNYIKYKCLINYVYKVYNIEISIVLGFKVKNVYREEYIHYKVNGK